MRIHFLRYILQCEQAAMQGMAYLTCCGEFPVELSTLCPGKYCLICTISINQFCMQYTTTNVNVIICIVCVSFSNFLMSLGMMLNLIRTRQTTYVSRYTSNHTSYIIHHTSYIIHHTSHHTSYIISYIMVIP